jgi:hypothetical protein
MPDSVALISTVSGLSEEWGGTYLQVIVTLVIFALGIPAILIQTVTAPEVHRIAADRRHDGSRLLVWLMAVYVVLAFGFVTTYHRAKLWHSALDDRGLGFVATTLVAITVALWWRQLRLPARDRLAHGLSREAFLRFRKTCAIPDALVSDLRDLGTAVPRRQERRVVLEAIQQLIKSIRGLGAADDQPGLVDQVRRWIRRVRRHRRYDGDGLEQLLTVVSRIAADPSLPVDADNVELGASILLEAAEPLRPAHDGEPTADMVAAIRAFVTMVEAITLKAPETTVNKLLQDFSAITHFPASLHSKGLFQIGRIALNGQRNRLAIMCLNHLEDILSRCGTPIPHSITADLVGLAAHVWERAEVGRQRLLARMVIAEVMQSLHGERQQLDVIAYFLDQADFQTAAAIGKMFQALRQRNSYKPPHGEGDSPLYRGMSRHATGSSASRPVSARKASKLFLMSSLALALWLMD